MSNDQNASPICRGKNLTLETVLSFINAMPKKALNKADFNGQAELRLEGWTQTHSQIARQLAFYYEKGDVCYPRFTENVSEKNLIAYMKNWATKYFIPNIYTPSLQDKDIVNIYSFLKGQISSGITDYDLACKNIYGIELNNIDKIRVYITNFTDIIVDKDKKMSINKGVCEFEQEEMHPQIIANDAESFFHYFDTDEKRENNDECRNSGKQKLNKEPHNRIIFGAPGTGKSYILNEDSKRFAEQGNVVSDEQQSLKLAVENAQAQIGSRYTLLNAIGFKYSDILKNVDRKDLPSFCGCNQVRELRFGALAKVFADGINANEKQLNDLEYIKSLFNDENRGEKDLSTWANAIGYKFGDFLKEWSCDEIKNEFGFSDAQKWWLYRGAQASQIEFSEENVKTRFVERVTFHPNYSYAQFVGTYKPIQDEDDSKSIVYSYVPGPFMRTYVRARRAEQNETGEKFLLIIEEINRANVAAVFGDVFQLLDRNDKNEGDKKCGESSYPIAASEDIKRYLKGNGIADCNELKIPSNMYIWATMNSADQGVFPMDTAFKRRWEFEYIGVDDKKDKIKEFEIPMQEKKDDAGNLVKNAEGNVIHEWMKWNELRTKINNKLTDCGKNEDKLLGPFFISMEKLESVNGHNEKEAANFVKSFKSKVLMYLFEDVCKMRPGDLFNCEKMRYSEICKKFDSDGIGVFNF